MIPSICSLVTAKYFAFPPAGLSPEEDWRNVTSQAQGPYEFWENKLDKISRCSKLWRWNLAMLPFPKIYIFLMRIIDRGQEFLWYFSGDINAFVPWLELFYKMLFDLFTVVSQQFLYSPLTIHLGPKPNTKNVSLKGEFCNWKHPQSMVSWQPQYMEA